jgi:hypothetical protein
MSRDSFKIPTKDNVVWEKDALVDKCRRCRATFNLLQRRKHHCRACGKIFCDACSHYKANILGYLSAQRVCRSCFKKFGTGFKKAVMSGDGDSDTKAMKLARSREGNEKCINCKDCHPEWICMKNGIVFCMECAGIFRGLGTQISSVRSLLMDSFDEAQIRFIRSSGNRFFLDTHMMKSSSDESSPFECLQDCCDTSSTHVVRDALDCEVSELHRLIIAAVASGRKPPTKLFRQYVRRCRHVSKSGPDSSSSSSKNRTLSSLMKSPQLRDETPVWAEGDRNSCMVCKETFNLVFRRRHHCRICGKLVCGSCAPRSEMAKIPEMGYDERVRICNICMRGRVRFVTESGAAVLGRANNPRRSTTDGKVLVFTSPLKKAAKESAVV